MFITITTARTIIPHVALLIFLSSFPFSFCFIPQVTLFTCLFLVQKKFKRQTQVNKKVLESEVGELVATSPGFTLSRSAPSPAS